LGTLISSTAFHLLRKKYIKTIIFQNPIHDTCTTIKLARNLSHIKEKLISQKDVLIKSRRHREQFQHKKGINDDHRELEEFRKSNIKKFIKEAL
jgi:hypothetical protein